MLSPILLAVNLRAAAHEPVRRVQYVMGTLCDISAHGPGADEAITAAFAEIAALDRALSLYKKESDVSRLNASRGEWFACGDRLWEALTTSLFFAERTKGAFDPTILAVLKNGPSALASVGYRKVELNTEKRLARLRGLELDFNAIGKGIALDHAAKILRERGVVSALINFGGQIYALGSPPDASAWPVRLDETGETLYVRDGSVSTSGNAEHPGHIASPFTGERILESYSTTVVARSAAEADAWSTALFVLGPEGSKIYDGCFAFSGPRPVRAPACSRYTTKEPGELR